MTDTPASNAQRIGLAIILIAYFGLALLYATSVPKWNAPDEPSHFNYVKNIIETWTFPILTPGAYDFEYLEKAKAARFPDSMPVDSIRYESHQPPLYYMIASPLLLLTSETSLNTQVLILRLLTALFAAGTIALTFHIGRALFPADSVLPLASAALVAFVPMHLFMNAAIDNDSLASLLLSALIFSLVRSLRRGNGKRYLQPGLAPSLDRECILWGTLIGLGLLTKVTTAVAVPLVAIVILWQELVPLGSERTPARILQTIRGIVWRFAQAYGIAILLSGWWLVRNAIVYGNLDIFGLKRHDLVVVGQPLTGPITLDVIRHFFSMTFKSFWGVFGWMGIFMDQRIYGLLAVLTGTALLGLLLFFWQVSRRQAHVETHQKAALALLFLAFAFTFAGMVQYNFTYVQAQGRYLFPAIAPLAILFNLGLREIISPKHAAIVFTLLSLGLFFLDIMSLYRFIVPSLS
ncbi:MAG: glycosyltransferase family 39 protein [Chloroflexi bacterium]|nr:glycosyltransferase family 39 protein [Chloroflexota bacterium]